MKNKGFTLIELLAVILILGIISLIVVPTIGKVISESKEEVFKSSIKNITNSIEQQCQIERLKNSETIHHVYVLNEGKFIPSINIKGKTNLVGTINVDNECNISFRNLTDYNYLASKEIINEEFVVSKIIKDNYTELKYLESNDSRGYIKTGIMPNKDIKIEVKAYKGNNPTNLDYVLGAIDNSNIGLTLREWNVSHTKLLLGQTEYTINYAMNYEEVYTITNGNLTYSGTLNETKKLSAVDDLYINYELYLFSLNSRGTALFSHDALGNMRIYYCKIWIGDVMVRNFIPVLDNKGVPCMYDKVTKSYFYDNDKNKFIYEQ